MSIRIAVNGSTEYEVIIENGVLANCGALLRDNLGGNKAMIVSDSNVAALYLNCLSETVTDAGYELTTIVLGPGEQTKDLENYEMVLNELSRHEFESTDVLIALGGGVIGDLAGFVAASYKRGMKIAQLPTSLLAAVDASVGGKNAINLQTAKNQVGTIRNPSIVICDPELMNSLSEECLMDGYAEIIKYGILSGYAIIEELKEAIDSRDYTNVIASAVRVKRDIVEMDEADTSFRQYLNLGHMIGHAIEASSDYSVSHGKAVAQGLVLEARCCAFAGYLEMSSYLEISELVESFGFDISETYSYEELLPYIYNDKRIRDGVIQILVPSHIGDCCMRQLEISKIEDYIKQIT